MSVPKEHSWQRHRVQSRETQPICGTDRRKSGRRGCSVTDYIVVQNPGHWRRAVLTPDSSGKSILSSLTSMLTYFSSAGSFSLFVCFTLPDDHVLVDGCIYCNIRYTRIDCCPFFCFSHPHIPVPERIQVSHFADGLQYSRYYRLGFRKVVFIHTQRVIMNEVVTMVRMIAADRKQQTTPFHVPFK